MVFRHAEHGCKRGVDIGYDVRALDEDADWGLFANPLEANFAFAEQLLRLQVFSFVGDDPAHGKRAQRIDRQYGHDHRFHGGQDILPWQKQHAKHHGDMRRETEEIVFEAVHLLRFFADRAPSDTDARGSKRDRDAHHHARAAETHAIDRDDQGCDRGGYRAIKQTGDAQKNRSCVEDCAAWQVNGDGDNRDASNTEQPAA